MTRYSGSTHTSTSSRRLPKNKGDSVKKSISRSGSLSSRRSSKRQNSSMRRSNSRQRSLRSKSGTGSNRGSSRTVSVNAGSPGPSKRKERPGRKGTGSGKRHIENRFFEDLEKATKKNQKDEKKKRALNDLRSNGVKYKCDGLVTFAKKSGFKVSATFLPTWARGKPHVVLSKNWTPDDRPLRPSRKKEYVKGCEDVRRFSEIESEADDEEGPSQKRKGKSNLIKSPNSAKPLAASAKKGGKKKVVRCTICNSTYRENTNVLWMFCGGSAGKKCNKLAIHAACHFVVGKDQNEIDQMCKKFIRCYDCRQIEHFKKGPNKKGQKPKASNKKAERGQSTNSMDDFV